MADIDIDDTNTFIFTIARMNPPTPGHLLLVQQLIEKAIQLNVKYVYIILSTRADDNENPIACEEKQLMLGEADMISKTMINNKKREMIDTESDQELKSKIANIKVITICIGFMFGPIERIINAKTVAGIKDINLIVFLGEDRQDFIDSIIKSFGNKTKWPNVNSIEGIPLKRADMTKYKELSANPLLLDTLDMKAVPPAAMSASFIRNIVKYDNKAKFMELYEPYLDADKIEILYSSIQAGLSKPNPKESKQKAKPKTGESAVPKVAKTPATKKTKPVLYPLVEEELRSAAGPARSSSRTVKSLPMGGKRSKHKRTKKHKNKHSKHKRSKHKRTIKKRTRNNKQSKQKKRLINKLSL
jgi:hypothetical protein